MVQCQPNADFIILKIMQRFQQTCFYFPRNKLVATCPLPFFPALFSVFRHKEFFFLEQMFVSNSNIRWNHVKNVSVKHEHFTLDFFTVLILVPVNILLIMNHGCIVNYSRYSVVHLNRYQHACLIDICQNSPSLI